MKSQLNFALNTHQKPFENLDPSSHLAVTELNVPILKPKGLQRISGIIHTYTTCRSLKSFKTPTTQLQKLSNIPATNGGTS